MTAQEFIKACCVSGYASKKQAVDYTKGRNNFTDNDFIILHQQIKNAESFRYHSQSLRDYQGAKTTKRLTRLGDDH